MDMDYVDKYIPDINSEYIKERRQLKIKKRNLVIDTLENRELLKNYNRDITEVRLFPVTLGTDPFKAMMQIYDNKVSYVTLNPNHFIGVIIEDPAIADMHKKLYEFNWKQATPF